MYDVYQFFIPSPRKANIQVVMNDSVYNSSLTPTLSPNFAQNDFNFTVLFEESIVTIFAASLLLCVAPLRFWSLYRQPDAVRWSLLRAFKLIAIVILCLLKLSLLVLWAVPSGAALRTQATIAACALDLAAAMAIGFLSPLEHAKTLRPSILLSVFLFFTTILDIARARTDWLAQEHLAIPALSVSALAVKCVLLVLEALSKARHTQLKHTPEQTSGIYSLSFFAWLNPLIYQGSLTNLNVEDLFPIDEYLASANISTKIQAYWSSSGKDKSYSLAWAIVKALWAPLLVTMIPRSFLIAFSIAQPFLIQAAIDFVDDITQPDWCGYSLILAFGTTYLGIAISTAWYQYLTVRALAMIRASLISIIYKSSLEIAAGSPLASSAISLMGPDVERIVTRLRWVISTAPNVAQIALAIWILKKRIGLVCVAPVLVLVILACVSSQVAKITRLRQREWMQAVQDRVALTSEVLGSIKGMKMLGLTSMITEYVQKKRSHELNNSKRFRYVQIVNITLGNGANMLSPIVTFIGYGLISRYSGSNARGAATIFSSLSLLSILISPVNELIAAIPNLSSALECCNRIQQFITSEKHVDGRRLIHYPGDRQDEAQCSDSEDGTQIIELREVHAGWIPDRPILQDISIQIPVGSLTMVVGPVGCGKSTLLQTILGEARLMSGSVILSTESVAFCSQTPHLTNFSVRQNIIGHLDYDQGWYEACLRACDLDQDVSVLPGGDNNPVGSKGIKLSGGQRQRVAIARAIYARKKIALMDDCFSGLDPETDQHCFHQLIGPKGLFRQIGTTVVLVTHTVKWLPYADKILVLGPEGRLVQTGPYQSLVTVPGYVRDISRSDFIVEEIGSVSRTEADPRQADSVSLVAKRSEQHSTENRGARDPRNLLFYIDTMGKRSFGIFLTLVTLQVLFTAIQPLWLGWWVEANRYKPDTDVGKWLGTYAMLGISALSFLCISSGYYLISLVPKSASALHYSILKSTMSARMTFISATDSGTLLNRFTQDMTLMDMDLPMSLLLSTSGLGNSVAAAILTCVSSGYMALCVPLLGFGLFYLQKFYLQTSRQMRLLDLEAKSPLFTHLSETIDGIQTIRAFQWKQNLIERNFELLDLAQRPFYLLLCLQNWLNLVLDIAVTLLSLILIILIVILRRSTNASLLGVSMVSIVSFSQTLSSFVSYWTSIETSLGAVARTRHFIAETPPEPSSEITAPNTDWLLDHCVKFQNVSASYQVTGPNVIQDVNLSIDSGHRVAVCGRTGSGKSTLVSLILRLLEPKSGKVFVGQDDVALMNPESIRATVSSLPQDPWFIPGCAETIRSNLDPWNEATEPQIQSALDKTGLSEKVESMGGLSAKMHGNHFSLGQQQLFCLARAMLTQRSKILLLDEATSSVDARTEELMMSILRTEFHGWTIVAIVHKLQSIIDFDRVLVLDQGKVVEFDSPKRLLADKGSTFAKLYYYSI